MIDQKLLKNSPEDVKKSLLKKGYSLDIKRWNDLESKRSNLQELHERKKSELNNISKEIGQLKSKGNSNSLLANKATTLSKDIKKEEKILDLLLKDIAAYLLDIPNIPDSTAPDGESDKDNLLIREWGSKPIFDFPARDHTDLGILHKSIDFEAASSITGSRFVVLHNSFAKLQRALTQFMIDFHVENNGYKEVYVPYIVSADSLQGTGQLPKFSEDLFKIEGNQNYYLSPTAEVPVTNLFKNKILESKELPIKYVCHTPCFRSEAGSYGQDTKGIMRQHQFEKVELVQAVEEDDSDSALEELTLHAESILQALDMPYRVVSICTGDLSFASVKTYDIEVWVPSQKTYREISSCSNCRDFAARRMKARWRSNESTKPKLINTLNGSGLAVGRTLLALLELNQQKDGSIVIPKALNKYISEEVLVVN